MFCPKCGSKLPDDAKFCEKCGNRVSGSAPIPGAETKPKSGMPTALKIGLPVGLGLIAVALVVVLIFVINGNSGGDGSTVPMAEQTAAPATPEPTQAPSSEEGADTASTEQPTPTEDAGSDDKSEPTPEPESTEPKSLSKSECRELCDELYNSGTVTNAHKKTLMKMSTAVLDCMYDKKDLLLSDMDEETREWIESSTLCGLYLEDGDIVEPLSRDEISKTYDKEEVLDYWQHFWGRDPEIPHTHYDYNKQKKVKDDGDTITIDWEDGDVGSGFYTDSKVRVYEDDSYYLVVGYEDYNNKCPLGQVLIRKDEWELPGTVIYARHGKALEIHIKKITATSHLSNYKYKTYVASNMIDGKRKTVWATNGSAVGESIDISLFGEQTVHGIAIMNGYQESTYLYKINGKVKRFTAYVEHGNPHDYKVEYTKNAYVSRYDLGKYDYIFFKEPVSTSSLTIEILNTASGKKYSDTCISELFLF